MIAVVRINVAGGNPVTLGDPNHHNYRKSIALSTHHLITRSSQNNLIANFNSNYSEPSTITFVIGICVAIAILVPLFFTRSVLQGMFGGAVSWGLIAVIVYYPVGRGDMAGLPAIAAGVTCAVAGTVAG